MKNGNARNASCTAKCDLHGGSEAGVCLAAAKATGSSRAFHPVENHTRNAGDWILTTMAVTCAAAACETAMADMTTSFWRTVAPEGLRPARSAPSVIWGFLFFTRDLESHFVHTVSHLLVYDLLLTRY